MSAKKNKKNTAANPIKIWDENTGELLPLDFSLLWGNDKSTEKKSSQKKCREKKVDALKKCPFYKFNPETKEYDLLRQAVQQPTSAQKSADKKVRMPVRTPTTSNKSTEKQRTSLFTIASRNSPNEPKKRKTDHSVRKELFKVPQNKPRNIRHSLNKVVKFSSEESPLGYPFKPPSQPQFKFNQEPIIEQDSSPSSDHSEFLELEKICEVENKTDQSPVSSVCTLMENNMQLESSKKDKLDSKFDKKMDGVFTTGDNFDPIAEIERILENDRLECLRLKTHFKKFEELHQNNMEKVTNIVKMLKEQKENCSQSDSSKSDNENKENCSNNSRRSLRLLNKNTTETNQCPKVIASPVMRKPSDLRKTTLTKSLVTKYQQSQIQSPRMEKTLHLYDALRRDITILSTPKMDRSFLLSSPKSMTSTRSLSMRIQKQCFMLQDTPVHK